MEITFQTMELLDQIAVHDSEFLGYSYDYENRTIKMSCTNLLLKKRMNFVFANVILSHLQSCSFWGRGYNIMWMKVCQNHEYLDQLMQIQKRNQDDYWGSELDKGMKYLTIEVTINSGDTLLIICEKLVYEDAAS